MAVSAQYSHCANPSSATAVRLGRPQFAQFHLCRTESDARSVFAITRTHFLRRNRRRALDCLGVVQSEESE
jgi:hypothetical protein